MTSGVESVQLMVLSTGMGHASCLVLTISAICVEHASVTCGFCEMYASVLKILYDLGRVHFYQQNYEKADTSFSACKNLMSKVRLLVVHFCL